MSEPQSPPPSKSKLRGLLLILAMSVAGGMGGIALGGMIGRRIKASGVQLDLGVADLLVLGTIMFSVILIHELGHVVGGLMGNMRFLMLTTGPFKITSESGRLRLSLTNQVNVWGGLALMIPRTTDQLRRRTALMIAGGPAASLLLALTSAVFALGGTGRVSLFGMALAAMSGGIFLVTILPLSAGGFLSDGFQLRALWRGEQDAEGHALLIALAGSSLSGVRPREYDRTLVSRLLMLGGPAPARMAAHLLAAISAVDRAERADDQFEAMIPLYAESPSGLRQGFAHWLAWYFAAVKGEVALAEQWEAEGKGGLVDESQRALTRAVIALAKGDRSAALAAATAGLSARVGMDPGGHKLLVDLLTRVAEEARQG